MDPNTAWEAVLEGDHEAAENLAEWLLNGGFPPTGETRDEVLLYIQSTFEESELDSVHEDLQSQRDLFDDYVHRLNMLLPHEVESESPDDVLDEVQKWLSGALSPSSTPTYPGKSHAESIVEKAEMPMNPPPVNRDYTAMEEAVIVLRAALLEHVDVEVVDGLLLQPLVDTIGEAWLEMLVKNTDDVLSTKVKVKQ
jgi:hypothetical protein